MAVLLLDAGLQPSEYWAATRGELNAVADLLMERRAEAAQAAVEARSRARTRRR